MKVTMQEEKRYLKEIENMLICDKKKKVNILDSFKNEVDDFLNDNPESTYEKLLEVFGTPSEVANELFESEPVENIKQRLSVTKWIKIGIALTVLLTGLCYSVALIDAHMAHRGYSEEYISEGQTDETGNIEQTKIAE